ncbi:Agamous-like MADS-box protein [Vigna angularis]|uniref:Agamous-like MADS-box protein n=1 Tax=Phaseolus angularis TaxID=3914 RepID=A0A8T0JJ49_PHAAN|nr:Agamous-like MADS-box protein [Vigna angularis]
MGPTTGAEENPKQGKKETETVSKCTENNTEPCKVAVSSKANLSVQSFEGLFLFNLKLCLYNLCSSLSWACPMGRGKIEIKRIDNASSRQVTFSKRRTGLFKKAQELSILCDSEVAVIVFSNTGKLFEFSSSGMMRTLSRYNKCLGSTDVTAVAEIKTQLLGKDLTGLGIKELQNIEQQLSEGLLSVKAKKEELLMEQLEQSRVQIEELRCLFPQTETMVPFQYQRPERKNTFVNTGARCLNLANNCGNEKGSSDTVFHLGLPAGVQEEGPQERNLFK